jgi:hypothetical protein
MVGYVGSDTHTHKHTPTHPPTHALQGEVSRADRGSRHHCEDGLVQRRGAPEHVTALGFHSLKSVMVDWTGFKAQSRHSLKHKQISIQCYRLHTCLHTYIHAYMNAPDTPFSPPGRVCGGQDAASVHADA